MRQIKPGDEVVMLEYWPKDDVPGAPLVPNQNTLDCRLYGFCIEVRELGIIAAPNMKEDGLYFPTVLPADAKQGQSVAFHVEDAAELYPLIRD